jgi:penicillin-binding protein 1C
MRRAALLALPLLAAAAAFGLYVRALPEIDLDLSAGRSTVVLDRDGRLLRPFTTAEGRWRLPVSADDVDPRYLAMLKAFEDRRFDSHAGIDGTAALRAAAQALRHGRIVSGGSTLTMQVARLAEPRPERTIGAKLRQMVQAARLERRLSKQEILSLYLSLAPFGGNIEGVRAASFAWFGKEPKRLSVAEAALLVALPQSPELRRPDRFAEAARRARGRVLARAVAAGTLTPAEARVADAEPVPGVRQPFPALAPHLAEALVAERPAERTHRLTLDAKLQHDLEALARERAATLGPKLSVAMLVVDHMTGEIRASVAGADYFSADRAGRLDLTRALRSPGSALKPVIYGLAFDQGLAHPETMLEDRPLRFGLYAPENFDLMHQGMVTARKALQLSLNLPAVDLLQALGPQRFITRLREAGAAVALPKEGGAPGLAVALGGLGITLQDLTRLFAAIARGGESVPLVARSGEARPEPGVRLLEPAAAWHIGDVLRGAPPPPSAQGGVIAFKTGTSYSYRDAFAVGFDRRHTIGVWVGRPDNGAVPGLVGRLVAAPLLFEAFARLGIDPSLPPRPENALVATTATLPPPMRHLRPDAPKVASALLRQDLKVAYPPDGASLDLGALEIDGRPLVQLKASGGVAPFTWLIDGRPLGESGRRRTADWRPDGKGFVAITLMDATGTAESVRVRLQ